VPEGSAPAASPQHAIVYRLRQRVSHFPSNYELLLITHMPALVPRLFECRSDRHTQLRIEKISRSCLKLKRSRLVPWHLYDLLSTRGTFAHNAPFRPS
jgi:hypothetical protein